jgi:hypothetical protein
MTTSARVCTPRAGATQLADGPADSIFVDLIENPERFTGYTGHSAHKVWKAIYEENCFGVVPYLPPSRAKTEEGGGGFVTGLASTDLRSLMGSLAGPRDTGEEMCLEKRVFYRIISGASWSATRSDSRTISTAQVFTPPSQFTFATSTSISRPASGCVLEVHTAKRRPSLNASQAPNLECFISRIAEHPERLQNVYFDYVLLLRAFEKAGKYFADYDVCTGDDALDAKTKAAVQRLAKEAQTCPSTFDESTMFSGPQALVRITLRPSVSY